MPHINEPRHYANQKKKKKSITFWDRKSAEIQVYIDRHRYLYLEKERRENYWGVGQGTQSIRCTE